MPESTSVIIHPIERSGWTATHIEFEGDVLKFTRTVQAKTLDMKGSLPCRSCKEELEPGKLVWLVKDSKGKCRGVYCSVQCQRRGFFDGIASKHIGYDAIHN